MSPDGDLSSFENEDIEDAAGWDGEPGLFLKSASKNKLLDEIYDRSFLIHDWSDYAEKLKARVRKRKERERKKRDCHCDSHKMENANVTVTLTDRPTDQTDQTDQTCAREEEPELSPSKPASWLDEPFSWHRVIACWIEKTGFPIDAQANQRDAEPIAMKCIEVNPTNPYAVLGKVFDGWLSDDWVIKNRPPLSNLRKNFQKYAIDPPKEKPEPSRASVYDRDTEEYERKAKEATVRYQQENPKDRDHAMASAKDILDNIKNKVKYNS